MPLYITSTMTHPPTNQRFAPLRGEIRTGEVTWLLVAIGESAGALLRYDNPAYFALSSQPRYCQVTVNQPATRTESSLMSSSLPAKPKKIREPTSGLEPLTCSLRVSCSTS